MRLVEGKAYFWEDFFAHFRKDSAADRVALVGFVYHLHQVFLYPSGYFLAVVFGHTAAVELLVDQF